METPIVVVRESFSEEITPESTEALMAKMTEHAYRGVERVELDVSSPGGEVASAMRVYEKLSLPSSRPFELVTRNVSKVASMGNLLFLAGDRRLATPEATFLLHQLAIQVGPVLLDTDALLRTRARLEQAGAATPRLIDTERRLSRLAREERQLASIIERQTGLRGPTLSTLVHDAQPFDAIFARGVGVVHAIIPPD
jgi:Clp protease